MPKIIKLTEGDLINLIKRVLSEEEPVEEGLHDTSWENDEGDKITLMDLLNATEDIPVEKISVEELKPHLLTWDGDEDEVKKIESADLQYPILIFVDNDGSFISIIDGHHRAQKAARKGLKTIKAKVIPINSLPKSFKKVFGHMGKQEQNEGELTEKCWKGYTQKGMKTMFGKKYPNCVKKESAGETDEASSPAQQAAIAINMKKKGIKPKVVAVSEEQFERLFEYNEEIPSLMYEDEYGSVEETNFVVGDLLTEAEYQGRKVTLNKPFLTPDGPKKRSVYVKNGKGNVVKVNFGDPNMRIKKNSPSHRKSFRARHHCENPGPKDSARYWSCRAW